MTPRQRFQSALAAQPLDRPPVWIMRQAGRYLPEYRALKQKHSFLELIRHPDLATQVTLQPIQRFPLDAAILFSDILVIPEALGQPYQFRDTGGISLSHPIATSADIAKLAPPSAIPEKLPHIFQTLRQLRPQLPNHALLGFGGSPWTLACYMTQAESSDTFPKTQQLLQQSPSTLHALLEKLTASLILYFQQQIATGIDALQIFDSHASILPPDLYEQFSLQYIRQIIAALPANFPVILYAKSAPVPPTQLLTAHPKVLSLDHTQNLPQLRQQLPQHVALQGNLPPQLLSPPHTPAQVREATKTLLSAMSPSRSHILNLGHGILPTATLENVSALLETTLSHK